MPAASHPISISSANEAIRLSKRVAAERGCSRADAERLIVSGVVRVDGEVVTEPQARVVAEQRVDVGQPDATVRPEPLSVLWHKPPGVALPAQDRLALTWLSDHLSADERQAAVAGPGAVATVFHRMGPPWQALAPLAKGESGVQVLTQHPALLRHAAERAALLEQEWLLDGPVLPDAAARAALLVSLQAPLSHQGRSLLPARASWQSDTRIRLAIKGAVPGQLAFLLERAALAPSAVRRQRLGRLSLSGLAPGQWRVLPPGERL